MGHGNVLLPYTVLKGPLCLGDDNIIGPHVVIGSPGEDSKNPRYDSSQKQIMIGSHNIIREFSGIEKPCHTDVTRIGDHIFLMRNVQVCHDVRIEDEVVIALMVALSGHTKVLRGANLGLGAQIHQNTVIGQYSMIAMGAAITKNIKPFAKYIPGQPLSVNTYAVEKFKFSEYADEIANYVLHDITPTAAPLRALIDHYSALHKQSKRQQY